MMGSRLTTAFRSKFLYKYSAATVALALLVNAAQWLIVYLVFRDELGAMFAWGNADRVLAVAVALIGIGAAWVAALVLIGNRFMRPLEARGRERAAACQGEIGRKVEIDSPDEFGVLARSYNQMLDLIVYLIRQTHESSRDCRCRRPRSSRQPSSRRRVRPSRPPRSARRPRRWRSSPRRTARSPTTRTRS
jgi:methyl-accepting chemotaxis protein